MSLNCVTLLLWEFYVKMVYILLRRLLPGEDANSVAIVGHIKMSIKYYVFKWDIVFNYTVEMCINV